MVDALGPCLSSCGKGEEIKVSVSLEDAVSPLHPGQSRALEETEAVGREEIRLAGKESGDFFVASYETLKTW